MNPRIDDLIVLATLGELTEQEAQELDRAAQADPIVAADLADALSTAAALQSAATEAPPAALKLSVMDAIAGRPQDASQSTAGSAHDRAAEVRSIGSGRSRRRFTPWIAAAAAAIVVVVGAVVVLSNDSDNDGRSAEIAAVLEADDAQSQSVVGEIGELEFVYSPSQNAFVLVADSLQLPPDDATYQAWLVKDGGPSSLGTFEPDDDGRIEMRSEGIDPTGATIGITLEPAGGSERPTVPLVAESVT